MGMSRFGLEYILDRMVKIAGADEVLLELARAMSIDELEDNLEFIDRMNDWNLFDNEDED